MDVAKICDKLRNVFNEMNEQFFVFFTNCYVYKFINIGTHLLSPS